MPNTFREFLKISNGATLFKDIKYGQWGCNILSLDELISVTNTVRSWGYELRAEWLVFATWLGDCDVIAFDLSKTKDEDYVIDGEQGIPTKNWVTIKGGFSKWLDRLIVSQGAKYWRWFY